MLLSDAALVGPVSKLGRGGGAKHRRPKGLQGFHELVHLLQEIVARLVRTLGDEPGGLFGQHITASLAGPAPDVAIRHERKPTQITAFAGVMQIGEQVFQTRLTVHCGLHVAVQHSLGPPPPRCQAARVVGFL